MKLKMFMSFSMEMFVGVIVENVNITYITIKLDTHTSIYKIHTENG